MPTSFKLIQDIGSEHHDLRFFSSPGNLSAQDDAEDILSVAKDLLVYSREQSVSVDAEREEGIRRKHAASISGVSAKVRGTERMLRDIELLKSSPNYDAFVAIISGNEPKSLPHVPVVEAEFGPKRLRSKSGRFLEGGSGKGYFHDVVLSRIMEQVSRGVEQGYRDSIRLLQDQGAETLGEDLSSALIGEIGKTHLTRRFPFTEPREVPRWRFTKKLQGELQAGLYSSRNIPHKPESVKVLPGSNDYPTAEKGRSLGMSGKVFGFGSRGQVVAVPSPNLNNRIDRLSEMILDRYKSDLDEAYKSSGTFSKLNAVYRGLSEKTITPEDALSRLKKIDASIQNKAIRKSTTRMDFWLRRLFVSEQNRALQRASTIVFAVHGVRYIRWRLTSNHRNSLARHGMELDWCDDLAENPVEVSLNPKDVANILSRYPTKTALVEVFGHYKGNPLVGIYRTYDLLTRGRVPCVVHNWTMKYSHGIPEQILKRTRYLREIVVPPHPYCSCLLLPIYSPDDPALNDDPKSSQRRLENLLNKRERVSEIEEAIAAGASVGQIAAMLSAITGEAPEILKPVVSDALTYQAPELLYMNPRVA